MPASHTTSHGDIEIARNPQFTFDLHAEAPAQQRGRHRAQTISRNDQRRNDARVVIDKILGSHYKARGHGYNKVASLFLTWESTDLKLDEEVQTLQDLFESELGYSIDSFKIPDPTALNWKVAEFVRKYNSDDNLQIIYYAGHGSQYDESSDEGDDEQLGVAGKSSDDPRALFSDVVRLFRNAQADVLLIVDSCFASRTFSNQSLGRGKFELLASTMTLSPAPGRPGSFTTTLTKVMKELLQDKKYHSGFPTSILYKRLFHDPALKEFKPLLFDQSQFDYGKVWLRPHKPASLEVALGQDVLSTKPTQIQRPPSASSNLNDGSDVALDLKLHLSLTRKEDIGSAMNKLAKGLQYLPHVHRIDFQELHAGDADVRLFVQVLRRVSVIKKVIRLLRERVMQRKQQEFHQQESTDPSRIDRRSSSFYEVLNKPARSSTQTWNFRFAEFSNGTVIPDTFVGLWRPIHSAVVHQRRRAFRLLNFLSISYRFDFTGIWYSTARWFSKWTPSGKNRDELDTTGRHTNGHLETGPLKETQLKASCREGGERSNYGTLRANLQFFRRHVSTERISWLALVLLAYCIRRHGW
ncbi:MAG: hypothetical protein Q9160_003013 [Pyrenula sp. 1 TL-2023]